MVEQRMKCITGNQENKREAQFAVSFGTAARQIVRMRVESC